MSLYSSYVVFMLNHVCHSLQIYHVPSTAPFDYHLYPSHMQAGKNIERAADDAKDAASDAYETTKEKAR